MSHPPAHRERAPRRWVGWTVNTVLVVVVLGCLAWMAPSLFGFSRYVITGGSMSGTIEKGSVVFEKPVDTTDLEVGDVITYLPPASSGVSTLVTHRIVTIEPAAGGGTLFTTQGDANPDPDPWQFELTSSTQPVVVFDVPHVGWILITLADRQNRMLLIGGPAALIALLALGQLVRAVAGSRTDSSTDDEALSPVLVQRIPDQRTAEDAVPALAQTDADPPADAPALTR